MFEWTPKAKFSVAAALLGLFSVVLPWVAITASSGRAYVGGGESAASLIWSLVTPPTSSISPPDPAWQAWEQSAYIGTGLWILGSTIFLIGCLVTLGQAFESFRWGGSLMLAGAILSLVGIVSFSTTFLSSYYGATMTIGPSYGLYLALGAAAIALIPFAWRNPEDRWVRRPLAPAPAPVTPFSAYLDARYGGPAPGAESNPAPAPANAGTATVAAAPRQFCPTCGRWYLGAERACPADATPLKPVVDSPAPGGPDGSNPPT